MDLVVVLVLPDQSRLQTGHLVLLPVDQDLSGQEAGCTVTPSILHLIKIQDVVLHLLTIKDGVLHNIVYKWKCSILIRVLDRL